MKNVLRLLAVLLLFCAPLSVSAQTEGSQVSAEAKLTATDYARWQSVAGRAEKAVDAGTDTNAVFETLRLRIAGFRDRFAQARTEISPRISTLNDQIAALGPVPESGEAEPPDISARRQDLAQQLAVLQAPVQAAQEAFTRADGLIRQIDRIIRERQTERLLRLGPTPLNPVTWPTALEELGIAFSDFGSETRVFSDARLMAQAREKLPVVLVLLAGAIVLIARGRRWAFWLGERLRQLGGRGTGVWNFVVSLLRIALPLLGLYAFTEAVFATGLVGLRGTALLEQLPIWGAVLFGFRWLAERLFAKVDEDAIFQFAPERRTEARFYITVISIMLLVRSVLELLFNTGEFAVASKTVLVFPTEVILGLLLFRLGQILRSYTVAAPDDDSRAPGAGSVRIIRTVGLITQAIAVVGPVMTAIGYAAVGNALLYPLVLSLGLLGFVMTLQRFAGDLYGWLSGRGSEARESLFAVLVSFGLVLLASPVLALIWGARVADLTEIWSAFLRGFQVGDTVISPTDFLTFAFIFAGGYVLTRLLQNTLRASVLPKTKIDIGGQNALVSGTGYVGIFLAAIVAITAAGIDLSSLAIVAGALSVGIGFGLQNIVSNFVSGIILLIERPISEGDWIEVGGQHGYVRNISVRSTRIETFDRSDVIVPNSDLVSGTVTNYTRGNTVGRVIVPVGVAYGSDTRKIEAILREIAESHPMVVMNPKPSVVFQGFGASSLDFEIRAILRDVNWMLSVKSELNHKIAERFVEEGIEIPFPQQDLWLRNPKDLSASTTNDNDDPSGGSPKE